MSIGNITLDDPNQIVTTYDTYIANPTSLHQIQPSQNGQFLLNHDDVQTLFKNHGYSELRVKCFKPWHGRTLDAVLYGSKTYQFINRDQSETEGMCGNVRFLENDNSVISTEPCDKQIIGIDWEEQHPGILYYDHTLWARDIGHVILHKVYGRFECDDWNMQTNYQATGNWQFFIR